MRNNLIKKSAGVLMGLLLSVSLSAQEMRNLFIGMPDSLSGILTEVNRADMVDFLESHMKATVSNRVSQQSELKELTPDYLLLELSPKVTWEMKLLPMNESTQVICFIRTVEVPMKESCIHFYTTDWQLLDANRFWQRPSVDDFFSGGDSIPEKKEADVTLLHLSLSPEALTLTADLTTMDFVQAKSAEELKPYLRDRMRRYHWEAEKFILVEESDSQK